MTRKNETGQALVFTAVALVALIGIAGLGIDMGVLRYQKRLQQTAADAAAIAGASNLGPSPTFGGVTAGAQNAAAANGFTDNSGGATCTNNPGTVGCVTVTVNNPPASGPHATSANAGKYVEALVTVVQPTYFMKVLGVSSQAITARAVATNLSGGSGNGGCLYTLGPPSSSIEGVNINGNATLNAVNCGIIDNGNYNTKGSALTLTAGTFGMSGNRFSTGSGGSVTCTQTPTSCPTPNMPAASNPLASLTPPCSPCTGGSALSTTSNLTANPGTYTSITISGNGNVVFNPGLYIIDGSGGISITGTPTITGTGVTFYFTNGATISNTGTGVTTLTPPGPTGQYPGILFYQDPADTNGPTLGGNSGTNYGGVLYFPTTVVTFFGNGNNITAGIVVADAFALSGHPTVNLQGSASLPPGVNIITVATLVE